MSLLEEDKRATESLSQVLFSEERIETLQSRTERFQNDINTRIRKLQDEVQSSSSRSQLSSKVSSGRSVSRSTKALKAEAAAKAAEIKVKVQDEDTTLIKLSKAAEKTEQCVESYIQTLPMEATLQQDIQAPAAAVPASTVINIVLVGPLV